MKRLLRLSLLALAFLMPAATLHATPIELVVNGEFETPNTGGAHTMLGNSDVTGWSGTDGLEIWNQGAYTSPTVGSDGLATGQHLEIAKYFVSDVAMQVTGAISEDGFLDFSFDAWGRNASGVKYSLTGSESGLLASGDHYFSGPANDWEAISLTGLSVLADDTFTLWFQSIGGGSSGAHIDQVSLLYSPVPEPSTIMLFGLGLVGLAGVHRKRKV